MIAFKALKEKSWGGEEIRKMYYNQFSYHDTNVDYEYDTVKIDNCIQECLWKKVFFAI